jgi:hypothetical protein
VSAPDRNTNAISHGLHSKSPAVRVIVPHEVGLIELAAYANDMGDVAQWIASGLAEQLGATHPDVRLVGLYAAVAGEMAQVVGEFLGETGIKPSNLGRLDDAQFEQLMRKESAALSLILSQCKSAFQHLRDREELAGSTDKGVIGGAEGLLVWMETKGWRANPVLGYLASHIRDAKRLMREMAANRVWQQRGIEAEDDLAARLVAEINRKEG